MSEERQRVLRMLKAGRISVEEAEALIMALEEAEGEVGDYGEEPGYADAPTHKAAAQEAQAPAEPPAAGAGSEQVAGPRRAAGTAPRDESLAGELRSLVDEIASSIDVDEIVRTVRGSVETIRDSLERSKLDADRVKAEVRRAARRAREETRRALREHRRHGLAMSISRAIDGLWGMEEAAGSWSHDGDLPSGGKLAVRNTWGDVRLTPSPDALLHAKATTRAWGRDGADAAGTLDQVRITAGWEGEAFEIRAHPPATRRTRVDLDIQVPPGVEVDLNQVKGDVEAEGLSGSLTVHATSGDIRARGQGGSLHVDTIRGDVEAVRVGGGVRVRSMRGDVTVEACRGAVSARTKKGDIAVKRPTGAMTLDLSTASGDVEAEVARFCAGAESVLSTMSGEIAVHLGPDAGCSLTARVASGEIHTDIPLWDVRQDRRSLQASFGSPGAKLALSTMSGDIAVVGYSSPSPE